MLVIEDVHWADQSTRDLLASWSATFGGSASCWWHLPQATSAHRLARALLAELDAAAQSSA